MKKILLIMMFIALLVAGLTVPCQGTAAASTVKQTRQHITELRDTVWRWQDDRLPPMHVSFRDDVSHNGYHPSVNNLRSRRPWSRTQTPGGTYFRTRGSKSYLASTSLPYLRWIEQKWARLAVKEWTIRKRYRTGPAAIRFAFGASADEALSVSDCESGGDVFRASKQWGVSAGVGKHQYWGFLQMGTGERSRYGFSWTPLGQAVAAHRYFSVSGWHPWQCTPGGGLRW